MTVSNTRLGFRVSGFAIATTCSVVLGVLSACGTQANPWADAGSSGIGTPGSDGGLCFGACGAGSSGGSGGSSGGGTGTLTPAMGTVPATDCPGCNTFPPASATPCAASAPPINIVYPPDTVLVPPNMNVISVQWTPFGAPFTKFSVDFTNNGNTDWHIITACKDQTIDAQSGMPSGGCEVVVDPVSWSKLVGANRGAGPVTITVRGTTDGTCSTPSNPVAINFADQDLLGTYYYWKSQITAGAGVGGFIWKKVFGDLNTPEVNVTPSPQTLNATCNGCHSLSRDGSRMVVYSDDNDSDDEYSDIAGSYLDMTMNPATEFPGGITQGGHGGGGQPPGFSTIHPSVAYYVTSNGYPCVGAGGACPAGTGSLGYGGPVPTNGFSVWNGANGTFVNGVPISAAGTRPTMPDWSIDGKTVVYVLPAGEFTWRQDDAHIYGGSLYTAPYTGNGTFGAPSLFLASNGENNYYPSYSPDNPMSYVIFDRVDNMNAGNRCNGGFCPDDSFSNPAARLMLMGTSAGAAPIDLQKANGSPLTAKVPLSNSYPRWAPFVQTYKGQKLLWFTFSSTRDYGVRVLNQNNSPNSPTLKKTGLYQCYPSDAAETPGASHGQRFAPQCQEPQLWMAPINLGEAQGTNDPSRVAFWIPYQEITTHNHTAQWTWVPQMGPAPDGGVCSCSGAYGPCGANNPCGCCGGQELTCDGTGQCIPVAH
jgi:hypothetical protein